MSVRDHFGRMQFRSCNAKAQSLGNDYINVCKAIDLLAKEGILTRMPQLNVTRNIVAI